MSLPYLPSGPLAAVLLTTLAWGPSLAAQDAPLGPLTFEEGSPLHRVSLTPVMEGADPMEPGRWRADLWLGWSNVFEKDSTRTHDLFLDLERLITGVTVRRGMAPDLEVGGRMTFETTGGGILDSFISGWHQRLGLGNANRERFPEFAHQQRLLDGDGRVRFEVPRRTFGLEDVRLFAKWRVAGSAASDRALAVRGVVRIPTADNRAGEERADAGLFLLGRSRAGAWHLHGMAGVSTVRAGGALEGLVRSGAWHVTGGVERRLSSRVSALGQVSVASPRLEGIGAGEVDGHHSSLLLGLAGRLGDGWRWEASFHEDIPPNSPSVDFTVGLGLRRAF